MNYSPFTDFKGRFVLAVLLSGVILAVGLFGLGGQPLSWAAPPQNPHLQTVPPRPPEDDPPPPPDSAPPAETSGPSSEEDKNDNTASQPPEQIDSMSQTKPQLTDPSEQTDNEGQDEVQPTPTPNQERGENINPTPPAQPSNRESEAEDIPAGLPQIDLSLSQTVDNPRPKPGEVITFTITLSNNGSSSAAQVIVSDPLPPGLILSSATPGRGSYNSDMGLWTVGIITYSESVTLSLVVTVTSAGTVTNTAEITAAYPSDLDSTPGNGLEREDDWTSVPISTQSDYDPVTFVSVSTSALSLPGWTSSISWLYILCLGVLLVLSGIYLVNRA